MNSNLPDISDTAGVDYLVELGRSVYPTQPPTAGNLMLGLLPYINCEPLPRSVPLNAPETLDYFAALAASRGWQTGVAARLGKPVTSLYLHIPVDVAEDDVWEPLGVLRLTYDGTYWRSSGYLTAHALWLPGMPTWQQVKLTLKQLQWLVFAGPELCSKEV